MADGEALPRFGLYYPYISFRDDRWVKLAALYWPKLARLVPPGHRPRDSDVTRALNDELGFLIDLSPLPVRADVAHSFGAKLDGLPPHQLARWRIDADMARLLVDGAKREFELTTDARPPDEPGPHDFPPLREFVLIHPADLEPTLWDRLVAERFAVLLPTGWYAVEPEVGWWYRCLFTDVQAARNRLVPTTDSLASHAAMTSFVPDTTDVLGTRFGLLAVASVVPKGDVPVARIIAARQKFGGEFDRWRRHIDTVGTRLAEELRDVEDPAVVNGFLSHAVGAFATQPVADLRRGLADLGIETAMTALSTKFPVPSGLLAGVAPPISAVAGAAAGVVSLRQGARAKARARMTAPSAYLLGVEETLASRGFLQRVIDGIRKAAGIRG